VRLDLVNRYLHVTNFARIGSPGRRNDTFSCCAHRLDTSAHGALRAAGGWQRKTAGLYGMQDMLGLWHSVYFRKRTQLT